jgi:DNA repair exonuclease SbcCD ATPase subunit
MAAPETSSTHPDYAQEWITFLRKRNLLLGIVWPILLVLSIVAGFAAIYFYQATQAAQLNSQILEEKINLAHSEKDQMAQQLARLQENHAQLIIEVENLQNARAELTEQQGDSESQLQITSKMLENMEQQLALLKNENTELQNQLVLAKNTLTQLDEQYQSELAKAASFKSTQLSELNKQLDSRKTAYQALANRQQEMRDEMDRLSSMVAAKEKTITTLTHEKNALAQQVKQVQQNLQSREKEYQVLQTSYNELDSKLKALVSPIGSGSPKPAQSAKTAPGDVSSKPAVTGLEEIKKPAPKPKNSADSSLDYDQIKVLP